MLFLTKLPPEWRSSNPSSRKPSLTHVQINFMLHSCSSDGKENKFSRFPIAVPVPNPLIPRLCLHWASHVTEPDHLRVGDSSRTRSAPAPGCVWKPCIAMVALHGNLGPQARFWRKSPANQHWTLVEQHIYDCCVKPWDLPWICLWRQLLLITVTNTVTEKWTCFVFTPKRHLFRTGDKAWH